MPPEATETVEKAPAKSIVPGKYSGKYRNGGTDALAEFIKKECGEGDKFSFESFFTLCRINGLPDEKVNHYQDQVAQKLHGSQGRARMTLRNMLATLVRKNGKLLNQSKEEVALTLPKPAVSGAAAKAQEDAAAKSGEPASTTEAGTEAGSEPTTDATEASD